MFGKPGRKPARDGWQLLSSGERRKICKFGGLTKREHKSVVVRNRQYKKGKLF